MRLGVGAKRDARRLRPTRLPGDIGFQPIEVHHQRRRGQPPARPLLADQVMSKAFGGGQADKICEFHRNASPKKTSHAQPRPHSKPTPPA